MQPLNAEQQKSQLGQMSPKQRDTRSLLSQSVIHQGYGVSMQSQQYQQQQLILRNSNPRGAAVPASSDQSSGVFNPAVPATMYYSQHPSLVHKKIMQMQQAPPIPNQQASSSQVSYYANMMQHPLQVSRKLYDYVH